MSRYGAQFDITFLGIDRCDLDDLSTYEGADIVILGAPFDGGTSNRPGARFAAGDPQHRLPVARRLATKLGATH